MTGWSRILLLLDEDEKEASIELRMLRCLIADDDICGKREES